MRSIDMNVGWDPSPIVSIWPVLYAHLCIWLSIIYVAETPRDTDLCTLRTHRIKTKFSNLIGSEQSTESENIIITTRHRQGDKGSSASPWEECWIEPGRAGPFFVNNSQYRLWRHINALSNGAGWENEVISMSRISLWYFLPKVYIIFIEHKNGHCLVISQFFLVI